MTLGDVASIVMALQAHVGLRQIWGHRQRIVAAWLTPTVYRDAVLENVDHLLQIAGAQRAERLHQFNVHCRCGHPGPVLQETRLAYRLGSLFRAPAAGELPG